MGGLGDDEHGDDERAWVSLQQTEAFIMVTVVGVDVGIERAGVDQEGYRFTSARRISSIRSETSGVPLRPTPAAIKRRRPLHAPRCFSIASLVNSETVVPRRSAPWRSRASRSSGSFTVVRFMVCRHTISSGRPSVAGQAEGS